MDNRFDTEALKVLLSDSSLTEQLNIMYQEAKRQQVLAKHPNKIQEWVETKNGKQYTSYATRVSGKYVRAKTYELLIDKLYNYYSGEDVTLSAVWEDAKKNAVNVKTSTIKRYQTSWESYFAPYPIASMSFVKLSEGDWKSHYLMVVAEKKMTKKQVSAARDVVSMIYKYAIRSDIVQHNPSRDIIYDDLPVQKTTAYNSVKVKPFTLEEAVKISDWCREQVKRSRNPIYLWAIVMNLVLGLRVGELSALKWCDIDFADRSMTVKQQRVKDYDDELSCVGYVEVGNLKGYEAPRVLALTDEVIDALMHIKALGLSDDFVFPVFRYKTYQSKIKAAASAIGLVGDEYRSHSLRATAATVLYMRTKDVYAVQCLLGHTTVEMTLKYIKDMQKTENLRAAMLSDLSFSLSCRFVPAERDEPKIEKTPETLDFTGFPRFPYPMEHRGFEPRPLKIDTQKTP